MGWIFNRRKREKRNFWKGNPEDNPLTFRDAWVEISAWIKGVIQNIPDLRHKLKDIPGTNFALAEELFDRGEIPDALLRYRFVLKLRPNHVEAWYKMGRCYQALENETDAIAAYKKTLALDTSHEGARFMMSVLGQAETVPDHIPTAIVLEQFSRIAPFFDAIYIHHSQYQGHIEAELALTPYFREREMKEGNISHRLDILDLGCGTGLAGRRLRPYAGRMVGVDLAQPMLDHIPQQAADEPKLYQQTLKGDLRAYIKSQPANIVDVINASGVFNYIGAIDDILTDCARLMRAGAAMAFSVEMLPEEQQDPFTMKRGTARFGHTRPYLEQCADKAGLTVYSLKNIRLYKKIDGYQVVFVKAATG